MFMKTKHAPLLRAVPAYRYLLKAVNKNTRLHAICGKLTTTEQHQLALFNALITFIREISIRNALQGSKCNWVKNKRTGEPAVGHQYLKVKDTEKESNLTKIYCITISVSLMTLKVKPISDNTHLKLLS